MKRILIAVAGLLTFLMTQACNSNEETIKQFITKMYDEALYEDYAFLRSHCSPELLDKLQEAYPYISDEPGYATWLFRSGAQDGDGKSTILYITSEGEGWYSYTALDMGWEFTNKLKVAVTDDKIVIEDIISSAE